MPHDNLSERRESGLTYYDVWHEDGAIITTPGDFVDYRQIGQDIIALDDLFDVQQVTFDQASGAQLLAAELAEHLGEDRVRIMAKTVRNVGNAAKALEAWVKLGPHHLTHDGNPVMRWNIGNAVVTRRTDDSILPKKASEHSTEKIDGVDALLHALTPMLFEMPEPDMTEFAAKIGVQEVQVTDIADRFRVPGKAGSPADPLFPTGDQHRTAGLTPCRPRIRRSRWRRPTPVSTFSPVRWR